MGKPARLCLIQPLHWFRASRIWLIAAGCSIILATGVAADEPTSPPNVDSPVLAALPKLDPTKARIVFFRPDRYVGMAGDARIRIDGKTVGWAGSGSAVFIDHTPGELMVGIGGPNSYTGADFLLKLEPAKEYFVTLAAQAGMGLGGVIPFLIAKAIDSGIDQQHCGYGWCAGVVDRSTALPEIANLSISGPNPDAN